MYRRPKFLEALLDIRREMANEAEHDVHILAEIVRSDRRSEKPAGTVLSKEEESRHLSAGKAEPVAADTLTPSV
ncbi:MAG: hypothetical protein IPM59_00260 [Chloracidobacterium sp.]|nr:hypothetical protein [Chloracidobacterium sp.]